MGLFVYHHDECCCGFGMDWDRAVFCYSGMTPIIGMLHCCRWRSTRPAEQRAVSGMPEAEELYHTKYEAGTRLSAAAADSRLSHLSEMEMRTRSRTDGPGFTSHGWLAIR